MSSILRTSATLLIFLFGFTSCGIGDINYLTCDSISLEKGTGGPYLVVYYTARFAEAHDIYLVVEGKDYLTRNPTAFKKRCDSDEAISEYKHRISLSSHALPHSIGAYNGISEGQHIKLFPEEHIVLFEGMGTDGKHKKVYLEFAPHFAD